MMIRVSLRRSGIPGMAILLAGCSGAPQAPDPLAAQDAGARTFALTVPTSPIIGDARPSVFPVRYVRVDRPDPIPPVTVDPPVSAMATDNTPMIDTGPYTAVTPVADMAPTPYLATVSAVEPVVAAYTYTELPAPMPLAPVIETAPMISMPDTATVYEAIDPVPLSLPYGASL